MGAGMGNYGDGGAPSGPTNLGSKNNPIRGGQPFAGINIGLDHSGYSALAPYSIISQTTTTTTVPQTTTTVVQGNDGDGVTSRLAGNAISAVISQMMNHKEK